MTDKPRKRAKEPPKIETTEFKRRIVDEALELAAVKGWNHYALGPLAEHMGLPANAIRRHFPDANAIADAWFDRALEAMLAPPPEGFADLPVDERLNLLMLRWLDTLAPYRTVTAQMIGAKFHPPHVHHWVPAIFLMSRKLQLLRDAAFLHAGGRRQQIEELGLTALFLATLAVWCRDESTDQHRTRHFLARWLKRADKAIAKIYAAVKIPMEPPGHIRQQGPARQACPHTEDHEPT